MRGIELPRLTALALNLLRPRQGISMKREARRRTRQENADRLCSACRSSTLPRPLVEASILLAASRGQPTNVLKEAETTYKLDTDAIAAKVKTEVAAQEKPTPYAPSCHVAFPPRGNAFSFCLRAGSRRIVFVVRSNLWVGPKFQSIRKRCVRDHDEKTHRL